MNASEVLVTAEQIASALARVRPTRIAVAYVGGGWKRYVASEILEEIVVSPTLGSNPGAILDIMREIGHQNVYFLDELHAKIYLGEKGVVLGSCNLSDNGMADCGRLEVAVLLEDAASLGRLEDELKQYKKLAISRYPDEQSKIKKLRELRDRWNIAVWNDLIQDDSGEPPLAMDYPNDRDTIHILPYGGSITCEYDEQTIGAYIPEVISTPPWEYFSGAGAVPEDYSINEGDWVIFWRCNQNGSPRKHGDVSWMQVHHVVPHGVRSENGYTKLIGEASGRKRIGPPFRLGSKTQDLIRSGLSSGNFPELGNDKYWNLKPGNDVVRIFLDYLRNAQREAMKEQIETEGTS